MRNYFLAMTLPALAFAGVCGATNAHADGSSADSSAQLAHEAYTSAINSNNLEALVPMVTDDVVFLSPHEPAVVGKPAVRAWSAAYLKGYKIH